MTARWISDPVAVALLADIAASPPSRRWASLFDDGSPRGVEGWKYSRRDDRVRQLVEIADRYFFDCCNSDVEQAKAEFRLTADLAIEQVCGVSEPVGRFARVALAHIRDEAA